MYHILYSVVFTQNILYSVVFTQNMSLSWIALKNVIGNVMKTNMTTI